MMLNPALPIVRIANPEVVGSELRQNFGGTDFIEATSILRHRARRRFAYEIAFSGGRTAEAICTSRRAKRQLKAIRDRLKPDEAIVSPVYAYTGANPAEEAILAIRAEEDRRAVLASPIWQIRAAFALDLFERRLSAASQAQREDDSYCFRLVGVFGSSAWGRPREHSFGRKLIAGDAGTFRLAQNLRFPNQYAQNYDEAYAEHRMAWDVKQEVNLGPYRLMLPPSDVDLVVAEIQPERRWGRILSNRDEVPWRVREAAREVFDRTGILVHLHYWDDAPLRSLTSVMRRFLTWQHHFGFVEVEQEQFGGIHSYLPSDERILDEPVEAASCFENLQPGAETRGRFHRLVIGEELGYVDLGPKGSPKIEFVIPGRMTVKIGGT